MSFAMDWGNNKKKDQFKCDIVSELGVVEGTLRFNIINWNDRGNKYDLRQWNDDGTCKKGVTFDVVGAKNLLRMLMIEAGPEMTEEIMKETFGTKVEPTKATAPQVTKPTPRKPKARPEAKKQNNVVPMQKKNFTVPDIDMSDF